MCRFGCSASRAATLPPALALRATRRTLRLQRLRQQPRLPRHLRQQQRLPRPLRLQRRLRLEAAGALAVALALAPPHPPHVPLAA